MGQPDTGLGCAQLFRDLVIDQGRSTDSNLYKLTSENEIIRCRIKRSIGEELAYIKDKGAQSRGCAGVHYPSQLIMLIQMKGCSSN